MGFSSVMLAANGSDALELLEERCPCLIILDLLMPVMDGCEMIEALRSRPALAHVPIVISTSAPERAPAGIPVLRKPIDIEALWRHMHDNCRCRERPLGRSNPVSD